MKKSENQDSDLKELHPGRILENILAENEMSQRELAEIIGKPTSIICEIVGAKRSINVEMAVLLEHALTDNLSAEEWLMYQAQFDIKKTSLETRVIEKTDAITNWNTLKTIVNIPYLKKKVTIGNDIKENIKTILDYADCNTVMSLSEKYREDFQHFRKSELHDVDEANLLTWIIVVKHKSCQENLCNDFDINNLDALIQDLNVIFWENDNTFIKLERVFREYGIHFIEEPKLDKVPVDGYSFWAGNNPTIAITRRHKRLDNIAFSIFHELGHIKEHLYNERNREFLSSLENKNISAQEREANDFASKCIWGDVNYKEWFKSIPNPYLSEKYLRLIANRCRINLAIVTGQYQHFCSNKIRNAYAISRNLIVNANWD